MEAYCVKCKTKREIVNPEAMFTATGTPAVRGDCPVCGTRLFRMGRVEAHKGLTPPKVEKKNSRKGKLVIVESPAKATTIGKYLGKDYTVRASVGHVRDLLKSQLSVDIDNGFEPKYRVPNEKRQVIKEIKKLSDSVEEIYLATDPDREGEAIAWHLTEAVGMDPALTQRVEFNEITKTAVIEAFNHPRKLDHHLVDAQQARRVLDRLVGYSLSPILWRKVRGRLSAGRVQSVALRMIVDREREIDSFVTQEYWTIEAELKPAGARHKTDHYVARLVKLDSTDPLLENEAAVLPLLKDLERAEYIISQIKRGERQRRPAAPFTTSTLQQEASRRLGFTTSRTMSLAQQLYEGIDTGGDGSVGLITYMRTDSTNVSQIAQQEAREFIISKHGASFIPEQPPVYKTRSRGAQEAHEAIRPTSVLRDPEEMQKFLNKDQYRLYKLIWQRFLASQMANAIYDTVTVDIPAETAQHAYLFRATGSLIKFAGFLVVYEETLDEDQFEDENAAARIPASLQENQRQDLVHLKPEQHFTQPPPRYTEATLVRSLEENGIGRPSTYAPIISTIQQRGYVTREKKRLFPTETGIVVNDLLAHYFPNILDTAFTANLEEGLDKVASGEASWTQLVGDFYWPFSEQLDIANAEMPEVKMEPESVGRPCPLCGKDLIIRIGRYGKFISCSGFPECRHTEPILEKIGIACPKDGGDLVLRRSRKGRVFYGCANYPECDFVTWKRPVAKPCPQCGGMLVQENKSTVRCTQCESVFSASDLEIELTQI